MGLSGQIGAGFGAGLEELIARQLLEAKFEEQKRAQAAQEAQQSAGLAQRATEHQDIMSVNTRRLDEDAADRQFRANREGVQDMERQADRMNVESGLEALTTAASDESLPPNVRRMVDLVARSKGVVKPEAIGPQDMMSDDERRAEEVFKTDEAIRRGVATSRASRPKVDVRNIPSSGPNGEPGNKIVTFMDGVKMGEIWEPANPSAGERQALADGRTIFEAFDAVREAYDPSLVGPVQGRYGAVAQNVPGLSEPQGFTDLRSKLAQVQNSLLYLRTGKQINEQEFARMMKELPSETDKPENFVIKLDNSERLMKELMANKRSFAGIGPEPPMVSSREPTEEAPAQRKPIPGIPGGEAEFRNGRWIRVK